MSKAKMHSVMLITKVGMGITNSSRFGSKRILVL